MAGRYATALFELARDEKSIDAMKADLEATGLVAKAQAGFAQIQRRAA